jgi:hypothetical protein
VGGSFIEMRRVVVCSQLLLAIVGASESARAEAPPTDVATGAVPMSEAPVEAEPNPYPAMLADRQANPYAESLDRDIENPYRSDEVSVVPRAASSTALEERPNPYLSEPSASKDSRSAPDPESSWFTSSESESSTPAASEARAASAMPIHNPYRY